MEICDETTAKFMGEALLNHAREIWRYARTYSAPIYPDRQREKGLKEKFTVTVQRMLNEMNALMMMAKYKGVSRFCNQEQIDAYIEEARSAIDLPAETRMVASPMFN